MRRSERVNLRIDPETKAKLQAAADQAERTLSDYIALILKREMEKINAERND